MLNNARINPIQGEDGGGEYPENLLPCEHFYAQDWCSVWSVYVSEHSSVNLTPALYEEKYRPNNCVI